MKVITIPRDSQMKLIKLSRMTLDNFVRGQIDQTEEIKDKFLLSTDYGVFVTLHREKKLRGCLGTCFPKRSLYETVIEMTQGVALNDYRFSPVSRDELSDIRIELSVISAIELVVEPLSLEVGRHGLYVAYEDKKGVLLPQVATEHGWDIEMFLSQVCLKADLPQNAWKRQDTKVSSFTALIIEESRRSDAALSFF